MILGKGRPIETLEPARTKCADGGGVNVSPHYAAGRINSELLDVASMQALLHFILFKK